MHTEFCEKFERKYINGRPRFIGYHNITVDLDKACDVLVH